MKARSDKAKREGKRDPLLDEEDDDPEEKEWPANVARLGENTSLCYWQFTKCVAVPLVVSLTLQLIDNDTLAVGSH